MNISLPAPLKAWVDDQVADAGFSTASEYIRHLLREEQQRRARDQVDAKLREAIESGPATPLTRRDWDRIRREGVKRLKPRRPR